MLLHRGVDWQLGQVDARGLTDRGDGTNDPDRQPSGSGHFRNHFDV
jgi:hypothetical protein